MNQAIHSKTKLPPPGAFSFAQKKAGKTPTMVTSLNPAPNNYLAVAINAWNSGSFFKASFVILSAIFQLFSGRS